MIPFVIKFVSRGLKFKEQLKMNAYTLNLIRIVVNFLLSSNSSTALNRKTERMELTQMMFQK